MKTYWITFLISLLMTSFSYGRDGDDAGNGGFAYKQSRKLLKMATRTLLEKVEESRFPELVDYPERRGILLDVLPYENLIKLPKEEHYRGGKLLSLDYVLEPIALKVYKPFYVSFMGTLDPHLNAASLEVQKRLLHEAAHIWGYGEERAEHFALDFLSFRSLPSRHDIQLLANEETPVCLCKGGESLGKTQHFNSCKNVCYDNTIGTTSLEIFARPKLSIEDRSNPYIIDLEGWCYNQLNSDLEQPYCSLIISNGEISDEYSIKVMSNNWLRVNIESITKEGPHVLEVKSSSGAKSDYLNFYISLKGASTPPISLTAINRYLCITRSGQTNNGDIIYTDNVKLNYMFEDKNLPEAISDSFTNTVCHDEYRYGKKDSILFPRLNLENNIFSLWSKNDSLMKSSEDGILEIDKLINIDRNNNEVSNNKIFSAFHSVISPESRRSTLLGYYLLPFTDSSTDLSYCPGDSSTNQSADSEIVRNAVGVDTQSLYMAKAERTSKYPDNYIFIEERKIKKIGFYSLNGRFYPANSEDYHSKQIFFFWPADYNYPLVMKSSQSLYRVFNNNNESSDKRIGCVPKIETSLPSLPGEFCSSDYQCSSLCCNESLGTCAEHSTEGDDPVQCEKSPGQQCIDSSFCRKESVVICKIRRFGNKCAQVCENVVTNGDCTNGICIPPFQPSNDYPDGFDPVTGSCPKGI